MRLIYERTKEAYALRTVQPREIYSRHFTSYFIQVPILKSGTIIKKGWEEKNQIQEIQ